MGRDHNLPNTWYEEVNQRRKRLQRKSTIIKEQSKDVNDEEIFFHAVAKLDKWNTSTWPRVTKEPGLTMVLAECVHPDFWVHQSHIGTMCERSACVTRENYRPEVEEEEALAQPLGVTMEWKNSWTQNWTKLKGDGVAAEHPRQPNGDVAHDAKGRKMVQRSLSIDTAHHKMLYQR